VKTILLPFGEFKPHNSITRTISNHQQSLNIKQLFLTEISCCSARWWFSDISAL